MSYAYIKQNRKANRLKLVLGFGQICASCGLVDDPVVYDFHHVDPSVKDFGIGEKIKSWTTIVAEAAKCVMVCSHCHRKIHAGLLPVPSSPRRFDASLVPDLVRLPGEEPHDACPVCGGPKRAARKVCSIKCSGYFRKGKPQVKTWSRRRAA